jgi:hypothetical protein
VLATPIALRIARREFDIFEPLVFFVAVWGLMFVARPFVMSRTEHYSLRDTYNIRPGITAALVLGLLGAAAFVVGYELARRRVFRRARMKPRGRPPILAIAVPAAIGFGVMAVLRGGSFYDAAANAAAYTYFAPLLTIPVIILLLRRGHNAVAFAAFVLSVAGFFGLGQRAFVIWPVSAVFVYLYLSRHRRPSRGTMVVVACLFLPLFTVLEIAREEQITPFAALSHPETYDVPAAVERFTEGDTTAMFPALALQLMTEDVRWKQQPGYWVYSTPTRFIPSSLWPDKPLGSTELLYSRYFPTNYQYTKAGTLFTLASEFYFDLGHLGVLLGLGAVGWAFGRLWLWVRENADDPWAWAFYAPVFGFAIVLFRGDVGLGLGLALFTFGPLLAAWAVSAPQRPQRDSSTTKDV